MKRDKERFSTLQFEICWCCHFEHLSPPPHLQWAALRRVQDQEAPKDSLAVCRHVEGHTIFSPQNTLSQFLHTTHCYKGSIPTTRKTNITNKKKKTFDILIHNSVIINIVKCDIKTSKNYWNNTLWWSTWWTKFHPAWSFWLCKVAILTDDTDFRWHEPAHSSVKQSSLKIVKQKPCNPPLGSAHQRAMIHWPGCTKWHPDSKCPPLDHHTSFPGKALGQHKVGSHRMCPVYCLQ